MDDDVLRRGRPTCHVEYDEATALLVGDSLQSLAFELLAREELRRQPGRQLEMVRLLARASGSCGMAGGQAIDLESVGKSLNQPELELMHALKTGALIRAAVLLGAFAARLAERRARRARPLCQARRPALPGRRRHPRLHGQHRDPGQDGRQGCGRRKADLRQPDGARARPRTLPTIDNRRSKRSALSANAASA
jgi:hypothetical protein